MRVKCPNPKCKDFIMTEDITSNGYECYHCMGCDFLLYKKDVKNVKKYKGK